MSLRIDVAEWISGAYVIGDVGLGVLGSDVPSTGGQGPSFLFDDVVEGGYGGNEVRGLVVTPPNAGTFYAWEDGSFSLSSAPNGEYTVTYRLFVDGIEIGERTASINTSASFTVNSRIRLGRHIAKSPKSRLGSSTL